MNNGLNWRWFIGIQAGIVTTMFGAGWAVLNAVTDTYTTRLENRTNLMEKRTEAVARQLERQIDDNGSKVKTVHDRMNAWIKAGWIPAEEDQ